MAARGRGGWRPERIDGVRLLLCLAAILVSLWLGARAIQPPRPLDLDAPPRSFSAARAMRDVAAIAMRPHPTGSADDLRVAAYLRARLTAMGLLAEERHYLVDQPTLDTLAAWSHGTLAPSELDDVIGVLPGRDRSLPALLLMAHHDTVWGSPGAPDDSTGVAAVLEIVRAIQARGRPARDVIVLFTDGEETGLSGARAFWGGSGHARRVGVVINLESRGGGGRATMFETGANNGAMIAAFARAVPTGVANSFAAAAYRRMPNNTDFSVPRDLGVPGFNFAFLGRPAYYHSPLATIDRLDPGTVQDIGQQALGIAAALAVAPTLPAAAPDATFFDLGGGHIVRYRAGAGWLVVLGALAALAGAWWRARPSPGAIAAGAGIGIWTIANAALVLLVLNLVSGAGGHPNYYDRLAALPLLEVQAVLACLGVMLAGLALRRPHLRLLGLVPTLFAALVAHRLGAANLLVWPAALLGMLAGVAMPRDGAGAWGGWIGLVALLVLIAIVAQIAVPTAAWLFAWPALILAGGLLVAAVIGRTTPALVVAALAATAATALLLPVAHLAMLGLGAPVPQIVLLFVPAILAGFWPLARMRPSAPLWAAATGYLIVALAIAVHVRTDAIAESVPAYSLAR